MSTEQPDHYAILNVPPHATRDEIGHAYRALLRRHHPDTRDATGEAQTARADAMLQHILVAYAVLRDPVRRARYDRATGRQPRPQPRRNPQPRPPDPLYDRSPIVAGPVLWQPAQPPGV